MVTIEKLVPLSRTKSTVKVDIRKGVLFLTNGWHGMYKKDNILQMLVSIGAPMIIGLNSDVNREIEEKVVLEIVHNIIGAKDIPTNKSYMNGGYFYVSGINRKPQYRLPTSD